MSRLAMLAVFATVAVAPGAAAGDCMMWGLSPKVINPDAAIDAATGGLVVAAVPEARGSLERGDAAIRDWQLATPKGAVKPTITSLAPGLAVYRPPAGATGKLELVDGQRPVAGFSVATDKAAALGAPKVRAIVFDNRLNRRVAERLTVELDERPDSALAVIVAGRDGKPRSWGLVGSSTSVVVYNAHDCQAMPNGTVASRTGDQLVVYFVDARGRISAKTKPIRVTANATPAAPAP